MALDATQRADATKKLIQKMFVELNQTAQLDSDQVRQLVNNLDDYVEANQTPINQAIDASIRNIATLPQKALALAYVAMKRGGII
jgi:heme oxygenase